MNPSDMNPGSIDTAVRSGVDKPASVTGSASQSTYATQDSPMGSSPPSSSATSGSGTGDTGTGGATLDKATQTAQAAFGQAREKLTQTGAQLREQAQRATEQAVGYTQEEPVKAMLVAAAAGAALMGLIGLITR